MQPFSYFLPKSYRTYKDGQNSDVPIKKYSSVFSHHISEYIGQKKLTDNGRSITFGRRIDTNYLFSSYQIKNAEFIQSQYRMFSASLDYDHSLYCCEDEICFLFKLRKHCEETCTKIDISCVKFSGSGDSNLQENVMVLEYNHVFNQYSCSLSDIQKKIVIVTGRDLDSYGTKQELQDNYLDILSYELEVSDTFIKHQTRRNLTEACELNDIDNIFFSLCGTKLFLVFGKVFVVYSALLDKFGETFELNASEKYHMSKYCFYVYNKYMGDILVMCQSDGFIYTLRERNLVLELLEERSIYLPNLGFNNELFIFMHIDYFDNILIYFTASDKLLILDYFKQTIVGKFQPPKLYYILDVKANWSGEEVFVFLSSDGNDQKSPQLNILFISKRNSLKDIAKLAVLQMYSMRQLKEIELPANLKSEMKIF